VGPSPELFTAHLGGTSKVCPILVGVECLLQFNHVCEFCCIDHRESIEFGGF
jgi:hypothetical protein